MLRALYKINGGAKGGCTALCKHTPVGGRDTVLAAITPGVETVQGLGFKCQEHRGDPGESEALGHSHF